MRKNIFQILQDNFDLYEELLRIDKLFSSDCFYVKGSLSSYSPENVVDIFLFHNWRQRNGCLDLADMKERIGIDNIFNCEQIEIEKAITYLEYIENIIYLAWGYIENNHSFECHQSFGMLCENIHSFLDHFNLETKYYAEDEMALIVQKDAAVTAVAEIVPQDLSLKIVKYNHYTLKGDIGQKKDIIVSLGSELEPDKNIIHSANKQIESDLFYMLNNLNLRHNNIDASSKNYKPYIAKMDKETIEEWYDEVYQLELLAFLLIDNKQRAEKIRDLKQEMEKAKDDK